MVESSTLLKKTSYLIITLKSSNGKDNKTGLKKKFESAISFQGEKVI